jgi:site-specific recombinase XerD
MKFVADRAAVWTRGTARVIESALRSYFKFLQLRGLCDTTLAAAVPTTPMWKLSSIPKALAPEDLDRFLRSIDRSTPEGRRNFAMALCMSDAGLRVCEVADLRLEDVDWRQAILRVPATKTRRARLLPLTFRVGRAIAAYLRDGRPQSPERGLFLLHYAPRTSATAFTVRAALRSAYDRSGAAPWSGVHALRHTLATRMVQQGAQIKEIADVLGHSTIDTTFIYTKVNLPMLRRVAMPWPPEARV